MTSFQTYSSTNHFRHPWFDTRVVKRKQPVSLNLAEDMDDEDDGQVRPTKRRKCTTGLENGLAHMSLNNGMGAGGGGASGWIQQAPSYPTGIVEERQESTSPPSDSSFTSVREGGSVVFPGSIEEPSSAPEVKMGGSSWYEPERDRIVITDLEGYAADSEEEEAKEDSGLTVQEMDSPGDVDINLAYLDHIRRTRTALDHPHRNRIPHPQPPEDQSRALVLFRPLPFLKPQAEEPKPEPPTPVTEDDDAMDLDV